MVIITSKASLRRGTPMKGKNVEMTWTPIKSDDEFV